MGLYFLLGQFGLVWQSAQTGVTPVWPASGLAFFFAFRFGWPFLFGIFPAMLLVAAVEGIPLWTGLFASLGSFLEVGVPLLLLRRLGVTEVQDLRSTLWFVLLGPMLGPVFSASIGVVAMASSTSLVLAPLEIWMYWWLGNSIGFLLVGGFGVSLESWRDFLNQEGLSAVFLAAVLAAFLGVLSASLLGEALSPLTLYLLMPLISLVAVWKGHAEVLFVALATLTGVMFGALVMHSAHVATAEVGPLYLNISLIGLLAVSGLIVSAAHHEQRGKQTVSWLAIHDTLTRLLNRHEFLQRLARAVQRKHFREVEYALMQVDLDNFKQINDSEGHPAGDQVLREVADILSASVRARDSVARIGGDEFMLLLDGCNIGEANRIAESIRERLEKLSRDRGSAVSVSASIGLINLSKSDRELDDVLQRAYQACYRAKCKGPGNIVVA